MILFFNSIMQRRLPAFVPDVEIENWLAVAPVDFDAFADRLELAFAHGYVEGAGLELIYKI